METEATRGQGRCALRCTVSRLARVVGRTGRVEERTDGLVVESTSKLTGAQVDGHGDHRIAMTMGIAGALASGQTVVTGAEAASISYPRFWDELGVVTGNPVSEGTGL